MQKQATKALKYYNGKAKIKVKWHLLVGGEQKCHKGEQKRNNGDPELLDSSVPISLGVLEGWGRFWGEEMASPPYFKTSARHARPGELTPFIFLQNSFAKI